MTFVALVYAFTMVSSCIQAFGPNVVSAGRRRTAQCKQQRPAEWRWKRTSSSPTQLLAPVRVPVAVTNNDPSIDEDCSLDDDDIFMCLTAHGYKEDSSITINKVFVAEIESLRDHFDSYDKDGDTSSKAIHYNVRLRRRTKHSTINSQANQEESLSSGTAAATKSHTVDSHRSNLEYNHVVSEHELVLVDTVRQPDQHSVSRAFHRAGPRTLLHFDPSSVKAAIVTCGGLCPGLNNVIRELVHALYYQYGAKAVWGVCGGFNGFHDLPGYEPILLTNEMVENIHHEGGTVLRSSRGGFDIEKILAFLREKEIQHFYVIGGDGTHRAAYKIHEACLAQNLNVAVAGIPKTIDNDVDFIDRSFGFVTAVEAAQNSIRTAKTGSCLRQR